MSILRPRLRSTAGCFTCKRRGKKCDNRRDRETDSCSLCARLELACAWPDSPNAPANGVLTKQRRHVWDLSGPETPFNAKHGMAKEPGISKEDMRFYVQYFNNVIMKNGRRAANLHIDALSASMQLPMLFIKDESSVAYSILVACSLAAFARTHPNMQSIELESLRCHQTCLQAVNQMLDDPSLHRKSETLLCVLMLLGFEQTNATLPASWVMHAMGVGLLMQKRDPSEFDKYPDRILLEQARVSLAAASLMMNMETFLSLPEWKTMPWASCPEQKGSSQTLLDIVVDLPSCMAPLITIQNSLESQKQQVSHEWEDTLRLQCRNIYGLFLQLNAWRQKFEDSQGSTPWAWEIESSPHSQLGIESPFKGRVHFKDFTSASAVLHFEMTLVFLSAIALHANRLSQQFNLGIGVNFGDCSIPHPWLQTEQLGALSLPGWGFVQTARSAAVAITRIAEFALLPEHHGTASLYIIFPLVVAYHSLGGERTVLGRWIGSVLQYINLKKRIWGIAGTSLETPGAYSAGNQGFLYTLRPLMESWNSAAL